MRMEAVAEKHLRKASEFANLTQAKPQIQILRSRKTFLIATGAQDRFTAHHHQWMAERVASGKRQLLKRRIIRRRVQRSKIAAHAIDEPIRSAEQHDTIVRSQKRQLFLQSVRQ